MKSTFRERVRKRLLKFGKVNRLHGVLVMPGIFICLLWFHLVDYLKNNCRRFAMCFMVLCLFIVHSSFSFPLFISGRAQAEPVTDEEAYVLVSNEVQVDELQMMNEEEESGDDGLSKEDEPVVTYNADDILASMENRETTDTATTDIFSKTNAESVDKQFDKSDWKLVLINKQHSIPEDYEFQLGNIAGSMQCDERIVDDLLAMLKAAKEDNINLTICSPYRSPERQVMLFERKIKRYMSCGMSYMEAYQIASQAVTVPGNSEHEVGLAFDILGDNYNALNAGFGDTKAGKWLAENSCNYGFILRYPKGKEYVTGIEYEPWHFRYVGKEAATIIMSQGITLEEFWEGL